MKHLPVWSSIVIALSVSVFAAKNALMTSAWLVVSSISLGVRTALMALLGLLVVILGCLIAFAFVIRRRPVAALTEGGRETPDRGKSTARGVADAMVCPACRRELEPGLRYCPHDAARLVPAPEMLERLHGKHHKRSVCPRCRRAFEGRVRFCPHDGSDLVPAGAYRARSSADQDPEHDHGHDHGHDHDDSSAKICPACQGRYGFAATFCGKDGVELVVLN